MAACLRIGRSALSSRDDSLRRSQVVARHDRLRQIAWWPTTGAIEGQEVRIVTIGDARETSNAEVAELRDAVSELQDRFATLYDEVRTRRLVVIDDSERERVVAEVVGDVVEVRLDLPPAERGSRTSLLCFTTPGTSEMSAGLGAQLWVDGDLVGEVAWWEDGGGARNGSVLS